LKTKSVVAWFDLWAGCCHGKDFQHIYFVHQALGTLYVAARSELDRMNECVREENSSQVLARVLKKIHGMHRFRLLIHLEIGSVDLLHALPAI
jgi:hypothetical protein